MAVLTCDGDFAHDLGEVDERVLVQWRTDFLAVLGALLWRPLVEPRQSAGLGKLIEVILAVSVSNFLDLIERSEGERFVFVDGWPKVLAVIAVLDLLLMESKLKLKF